MYFDPKYMYFDPKYMYFDPKYMYFDPKYMYSDPKYMRIAAKDAGVESIRMENLKSEIRNPLTPILARIHCVYDAASNAMWRGEVAAHPVDSGSGMAPSI